MITTIAGNNSFGMKGCFDKIVSDFIAKYGELAIERIDAQETDSQVILDAVQSVPFLAERKLVIIRGLGSNKAAAGNIEQILSSIPEDTEVVLYEPVTDKRSLFYKTLKAKTQYEEYNELDRAELSKWLVVEAKKAAAELNLADANYLVERIGANQMLLANELEKLLTYDSKITRDSINLLVEPTPQSKIFDLLDAAFGGSKKQALEIYEEQRAQKIEPQAIMAMIAWQLRLMTLAQLGKGKSTAMIAKDSGASPYPIEKASRLVQKLGSDRLKKIAHEALEIDWRSKTEGLDLDEALKTYIVTL